MWGDENILDVDSGDGCTNVLNAADGGTGSSPVLGATLGTEKGSPRPPGG